MNLLLALALVFSGSDARGATAVETTAPRRALGTPQESPKPHEHVWTKQTKREWVAPKTKQVQVGTDAKGRPIYETQIVTPGYWKTSVYYVCACGATRN